MKKNNKYITIVNIFLALVFLIVAIILFTPGFIQIASYYNILGIIFLSLLILILIAIRINRFLYLKKQKSKSILILSSLTAVILIVVSFYNVAGRTIQPAFLISIIVAAIIIFSLLIKTFNKNKVNSENKNNYLSTLIIFSIFIAVRIGLLLWHLQLTFPDDWLHIISGAELVKHGSFPILDFSFSNGYIRGAYVSLISAGVIATFGINLIIIKAIPVVVGVINFFLTRLLAVKIGLSKKAIYFVLFVYAINYWTVFGHLYLRMYVFYELFVLLCLWSILELIDNRKKENNSNKQFILIIFIVLINIINWFGSYDTGKFIVPVICLTAFLYVYIFKPRLLLSNSKHFLSRALNTVLKSNILFKILLLVSVATVVFFVFKLNSQVVFLMTGQITGIKGSLTYFDRFFINSVALTILFFVSLISISEIKNTKSKIIITCAFVLFILHLFSNIALQSVRSIFYIMPLFILSATIAFDRLRLIPINKYFHNTIIFGMVLAIFLGILSQWPNDFYKRLYIPGETLKQHDHHMAFEFAKKVCKNEQKAFAFISTRYNLIYQLDNIYKIDLQQKVYERRMHYTDTDTGKIIEYGGEATVINNKQELFSLLKKNNTCVFVASSAKSELLDDETYRYFTGQCLDMNANALSFKAYFCKQIK